MKQFLNLKKDKKNRQTHKNKKKIFSSKTTMIHFARLPCKHPYTCIHLKYNYSKYILITIKIYTHYIEEKRHN